MGEADERPSKIRRLNSSENENNVEPVKEEHPEGGAKSEIDDPSREDDVEHDSEEEGDVEAPIDGNGTENGTEQKALSKNQLKKLKKKAEWEAGKEWRRAKRKEKNKLKKQRKREGIEPTMHDSAPKPKNLPSSAPQRPKRSILTPITLVIDCGFDDLMTEKEMISLGSQVTRSYSDNKVAPYRAHLTISSFNGHLKERFETVLAKHHLGWKGVKFTGEDFVTAAQEAHSTMYGPDGGELAGAFSESKNNGAESVLGDTATKELSGDVPSDQALQENDESESTTHKPNLQNPDAEPSNPQPEKEIPSEPSIVYLTSDSPHTLEKLSPYTTYIIGGLVDKNRHKGICYKRARELGIPTAKLPIGEFMVMQSRVVLATNHVVEIMIRWLEYADWGQAFLRVIPKRKEAKLRGQARTGEGEDEENLEEEAGDDVIVDNGAETPS